MNEQGRQMARGFVQAAQRSWRDDDFKQLLSSSPRDALAQEGWEIPDRTEVEVSFIEPPEAPPRVAVDDVVASWERAIDDGRLHLRVPSAPPSRLESQELSDEELTEVAGGGMSISDMYPFAWYSG